MTAYPSKNRYPAQPQPAVNPWLVRLPILFVSGVVLLLGSLAALIIAFQMRYSNLMMPGMSAYGINLSGMTRDQAAAALEEQFRYGSDAVFTFRYGDQFWQMTAADLGVSFDVDATVDEAYNAGRSGDYLSNLVSQASIWLNGRGVTPIVRFDQNVTVSKLETIAVELNRPPHDATITIEGTTVMTTPGEPGKALDILGTLNRLQEAVLALNTGAEIPLVVSEAPPTIWDAEAAATKVRNALTGPITLVAENPAGGTFGPWTATVDQIRAVLQLKLVTGADGKQSYDVDANTEAFRDFIENLAPGLIGLPQDARFNFDESSGQLIPVKAGVSGRALDVDGSLARLKESIFNPTDRIVPLAFTYTLPIYSDNVTAAELGITQMVAEATTFYTGSTKNRKDNIIQAASHIDGVIIAPGEEFSFNKYIGDISPETGFVQGKIIFGGKTIDGVGGGVCQVSTTAFRAALKAGYPIIERNSHGYRVGFYEQQGSPPGLDAAIFQPTADFRFVNDTQYHLLIETSVFPANDSIQFRFYSTNPGRQVILEGPVIKDVVPPKATVYVSNPEIAPGNQQYIDWAAEGADVTFTRRILDAAGNEIRTDTIYTHYLPWAAVVEVAPGDPRITA
ncbi:MAG: VanW family protein [Anaerolineae bacterium]|nr:VanW family protein [Anaerolineae bacterium]